MKIAIDALAANYDGMFSYLQNIIPNLLLQDDSLELLIIANEQNTSKFQSIFGESKRISYVVIKIRNPVQRILWENLFLNRILIKYKADILFCPIPPAPLICSIPNIVAIRNMAPYCRKFSVKPTWKELIRYFCLRLVDGISLFKASRIISVSKSSFQVLQKNHQFVFNPQKVSLIYHGRNPNFSPRNYETENQATSHYNLPGQYLLYVSPTWHYKNHLELIDALRIVKQSRPMEKLVFVGRTPEPCYSLLKNKIKDLHLEESIIFLGNVQYQDLPMIYNSASIMVYPSLVEACPNILIEAMACGVAIAASNISICREICEEGAIYFDPFDPSSIAESILTIFNDIALKDSIRIAAIKKAEAFSWEKTAKEMLTVFYSFGK